MVTEKINDAFFSFVFQWLEDTNIKHIDASRNRKKIRAQFLFLRKLPILFGRTHLFLKFKTKVTYYLVLKWM